MPQAIMNDGRQQMVHVWQKLFFDSRIVATDNVNPDYVKLAQSYDIEAFSCEVRLSSPRGRHEVYLCSSRGGHVTTTIWTCALQPTCLLITSS